MLRPTIPGFAIGSRIPSPTTTYWVQKNLGCGGYGVVYKCRNLTTHEKVAIKVIRKKKYIKFAEEEAVILKDLKVQHSDKFNIVGFNEAFTYKGRYCLVFEHLDMDLRKFHSICPGKRLGIQQIRPILQQLATSLDFLHSIGLIHTDLKPDNIMMVDHVNQPLKVKLIDFGCALANPKEKTGEIFQTLRYRSPEVLSKDPFGKSIDVWSLGCTGAELFMGEQLFTASNETDLISEILLASKDPLNEENLLPHAFRLGPWMEKTFVASHRVWDEDTQAEYCDLKLFIDLMSQMLMSQSKRITPSGILQHPFITMSQLQRLHQNSQYLKSCTDLMAICRNQISDDDEEDEGLEILKRLIDKNFFSSPAGPAKEGGPAAMGDEKHSVLQTSTVTRPKKGQKNATCGNRPGDSQAKVRRSERMAAIKVATSGQAGPTKCKRKRHDPSSSGTPSTKKRKMSFKKELKDLVGGDDASEAGPSNSTQVHSLKKRKRDG